MSGWLECRGERLDSSKQLGRTVFFHVVYSAVPMSGSEEQICNHTIIPSNWSSTYNMEQYTYKHCTYPDFYINCVS